MTVVSINKPKPKSKAEMMRRLRKSRRDEGLIAVTYWVTAEQIEKIEQVLRKEE
tara:strand:- start:1231 stop:1392 length:162 start_codon:yes stop_codon:yes gene_type:complete